jgi:hypothetical protein
VPLGRAAETDLVAVGIAERHLAHPVGVGLAFDGLDSPGGDRVDAGIEVVDEEGDQAPARVGGVLEDVDEPVLVELPYRLGLVAKRSRAVNPTTRQPSGRRRDRRTRL